MVKLYEQHVSFQWPYTYRIVALFGMHAPMAGKKTSVLEKKSKIAGVPILYTLQ